jgi:hypothetical protein
MDGLFVDAAPSQMRAERPDIGAAANNPARAAERRRDQGRAPEPVAPRDTRTSMQQNAKQGRTGDHRRPGDEQQRPATVAVAPADRLSIEGGISGAIACVRGPESGLTLSLAPGSYTIGRARENDLVLKDIAASRKHLRIDVDGRLARLVDLGSGNGTKVNGKRAGEVELRHGDTVEIGGSMLVYSEPGRTATVDRDEAQARVVAAADELARELSQKLKFGQEAPGDFDGHVAQTRAIRTADARAAAQQVLEEDAHRQAPEAAQTGQKNGARKPPDRIWNETFTNMPLSAVVADDQRLQGTGQNLPAGAPKRQRPATPPPTPAPFTPAPRPMGPMGTAADDEGSVYDDDQVMDDLSRGQRSSFLTSVLLSAGIVFVVGALAIGLSALFLREPAGPSASAQEAAVEAEKNAEYGNAISRAQDAITRQDWVNVRDYTLVALQARPKDPLALAYKNDAESRLEAALKATQPPAAPQAPLPPIVEPGTQPAAAAVPPPAPAPAPAVVEPPAPRASPPVVSRPKPKPKPTSSKRGSISDDDAKARFERAIDAFRSKDKATGCKLLEQVAERAPADSSWRGKADSLYLKRCGD